MRVTRTIIAVALVASLAFAASNTVAAQDMDHAIEFEDNVVAGEETTIVYMGTVYDPTVETTVTTDVEMSIDGSVVADRSYSMEMYDGVEIREEFTHTFDSAGEHEVEFTLTFTAFGQSRTASYTDTVDVRSPPAVGGSLQITPEEPGVVEVGSTVGGVTVDDVTLRAMQETSVFVEFEDEDTDTVPENTVRVVRVDIDGDEVSELSVSYSSESEAEIRLLVDDNYTTDGVEVEGDAHAGAATVVEPGNSTSLAFVDVGPEEEDDEVEEEDEGLPGFTAVAAIVALLTFAAAARRR